MTAQLDASPCIDPDRSPERVSRGIYHCLKGEWHQGLACFEKVDKQSIPPSLSAVYLSYMGHALARCERDFARALSLCEQALAVEFYRAEIHLNLASVHILNHDRSAAVRVLYDGLELAPMHSGLLALQLRLGAKRQPLPLGFLPRNHSLNQWLGRRRHAARLRQRR